MHRVIFGFVMISPLQVRSPRASLTNTQRRVSLTPKGSSSSAGRRGKSIAQGHVTRTRNIGYILILTGGGGLASQSPMKEVPLLNVFTTSICRKGERNTWSNASSHGHGLEDYDRPSSHIKHFIWNEHWGFDGFRRVLLPAVAAWQQSWWTLRDQRPCCGTASLRLEEHCYHITWQSTGCSNSP